MWNLEAVPSPQGWGIVRSESGSPFLAGWFSTRLPKLTDPVVRTDHRVARIVELGQDGTWQKQWRSKF